MAKLKGVTISLFSKQKTKDDPFGHPVYEETEILVDNVLIAPVSSDEVVDQLNVTGRTVEYILAIPKGDTNTWEGQIVGFFGKRWRVVGSPLEGLEHLIPLAWNRKITVERYE